MAQETKVGIEITSQFLRILEIKRAEEEWVIENFCVAPIEPGIVVDGMIHQPDILIRILKDTFQERKLSKGNVVVGIPRPKAIMKLINTPPLPDWDLREVISSEIEQYAFFQDKEPMFTYHKLGRAPERGGEIQSLVVATDALLIDGIISICDKANLEISAIELGNLTIQRLLEQMNPPTLYSTVIVDELKTDLFVIQGEVIRFLRSFDYGWSDFLKHQPEGSLNIAKEIIPEEAIRLRRALAQEVRNSLNFYQAKSQDKKPVENLYLYVGEDKLEGVLPFLQQNLGINISYVYSSFTQKNLSPGYEMPLSLSLRKEARSERLNLTFLPERYMQKKIIQKGTIFAVPSVSLFVIIFLISFLFNGFIGLGEKKLNNLKQVGGSSVPAINQKQKEIEEIKKKIDLENKKKELSKRLVSGLPWAKILSKVSILTPKSVWVLNITSVERINIVISGYGLNQESVVNFSQGLSSSALFGDVMINSSVEDTYEDYPVFRFEISCKIKEEKV